MVSRLMGAMRELLERDAAVAQLDTAFAAASGGHGSALLIEGPAGIGKTRLLATARVRAEAAGMRVLAARGGELEADFAFGVVRQLFDTTIAEAKDPEREALLADAASLAKPLVAPGSGPDPAFSHSGPESTWAAVYGLYW